jgi:hypothetical protein
MYHLIGSLWSIFGIALIFAEKWIHPFMHYMFEIGYKGNNTYSIQFGGYDFIPGYICIIIGLAYIATAINISLKSKNLESNKKENT